MLFPEDKECPRCGWSRKKKKGSSWLLYLIVLLPLVLVMSAVCGFYLLSGNNSGFVSEAVNTPDTAPEVTETPEEELSEPEEHESIIEEEYSEYDEPEITAEEPADETPEPTAAPYQAVSEPDRYGHVGMIPPKFTAYKASSAAEDVYSAGHAFDADMDTVWGTGGDSGGIGEWITLSADEYQSVSGVRIYNGNTRSEQAFKENARVKIVEVAFSDGSYIRRILQDGFSRNEPQIIRFEERINTKYLKITILDKYGESDVVCIGEISVF